MTESLSDKDLIQKCIAGSRLHQKSLFDMYSKKMMTVCLRYGRDQQEAEDILQEGFIKVFKSLEKYKYKGSFEGWIRKIILNTALNKVSKKYFSHERDNIDDYDALEATTPEIISTLSVEEILKIISQLPKGYKIVFNLYAIEGYSHKEIAEMLEIEEGTSRSQLAKARKMLQEQVEQSKKVTI